MNNINQYYIQYIGTLYDDSRAGHTAVTMKGFRSLLNRQNYYVQLGSFNYYYYFRLNIINTRRRRRLFRHYTYIEHSVLRDTYSPFYCVSAILLCVCACVDRYGVCVAHVSPKKSNEAQK